MRKKLLGLGLAFILAFGLVLPSLSFAASDESPMEPSIESPQTLPLPDTAVDSQLTSTPGVIAMGSLEGYQVFSGILSISEGSFGYRGVDLNEDEAFDIRSIMLDLSYNYTVAIQANFYNISNGGMMTYYDTAELTGEELLSLQTWQINPEAVMVNVDFGVLSGDSNKIVTFYSGPQDLRPYYIAGVSIPDISPMASVDLLVRPGQLNISFTTTRGQTGYQIMKSVDVQSSTAVSLTEVDVTQSPVVNLPTSMHVSISRGNINSYHENINKLVITNGTYNMFATVIQSLGNNMNQFFSWIIGNLSVSETKDLHFATQPSLDISNMNISAASVSATGVVTSGDFILNAVREHSENGLAPVITSAITLKDSHGTIIEQTDNSDGNWNYLSLPLNRPLNSGEYTLEYEVNYPGLSQPLKASKSFIYGDRDEEINGLTVLAEDEQGQPLEEGVIELYEKRAPRTEYDYSDYETVRIFDADIFEKGKFFIPGSYLLAGKSYEVVVYGTSADGTDIYYHQPVSAGQMNLTFSKNSLRKLTMTAQNAKADDLAFISVVDNQGRYSTWPYPVFFNDRKEANVYVQTGSKLIADALLYDDATDALYDLEQFYTVSSENGQTVNLSSDLISITPPAGFSNATVTVDFGEEASKYYVTKGKSYSIIYRIEKDQYRYGFRKWVENATENIALSAGPNFSARSDKNYFESGQLNAYVYSDYYDQQDNYLQEVIDLNESATSKIPNTETNPFVFEVQSADGIDQMAVMKLGSKAVYQKHANSAPSINSSAAFGVGTADAETQTPLLKYQLYDANNLAVGDPIYSNNPVIVNLNVPNALGSYTLKLIQQNFPQDVAKLTSSNISFQVVASNSRPPELPELPIELPTGYDLEKFSWLNRAEIWVKNGTSLPTRKTMYVGDGKLSGGLQVDPQSEYVIHYALQLHKSDDVLERAIYYNQVHLTGTQLLQLERLAVPEDAQPVKLEAPTSIEIPSLQYLMRADGFGTMRFSIFEYYGYPLIVAPGTFDAVFTGSDFTTKGYNIRKIVNVAPITHAITVTEVDQYSVKLSANRPFLKFFSLYDGVESTNIVGHDQWDKLMLNQAIVSAGNQRLAFITSEIAPNETPWRYTWVTREKKNIQSNTVIDFGGEWNAGASQLALTQSQTEQGTLLSIQPKIVSGELELKNVEVMLDRYVPNYLTKSASPTQQASSAVAYEGEFDKANSVSADISVKNASGQVVYEGRSVYWMDGISLNVPLNDGQYTLYFSLPIGPNKAINLSKAFSVSKDGGGVVNPGSGSPGFPGIPLQDSDPATAEYAEKDIPAAKDGMIKLDVPGKQTVVLPSSMIGKMGTNALQINMTNTTISIPAQVLEQLAQLVDDKDKNNSKVSMKIQKVEASSLTYALRSSNPNANVNGQVYELELAITTADEKTSKLTQFKTPLTLSFEVAPDADRSLTGIFYIDDKGKLTYIGGKWDGNKIVADVSHFSKYGALEYKKQFNDLSGKHWAYNVIRQLVAKQIVSGVTDTTFAPEKKITRAEFAALIVNALRLKSMKPAAFSDVPADAWYADEVSAAFEHGILQGVSANRFAPNQQITREQMAIMIVNAFKLSKKDEASSQNLTFKDADRISQWALEAVRTASRLGLLNGRDKDTFAPKDQATRAEAAQMIHNLLNMLQ